MTPLPGPLGHAPDVTTAVAQEMLGEALADLTLGRYDWQAREYLGDADAGVQAAIASWLRRCWEAGLEAGRAGRPGI